MLSVITTATSTPAQDQGILGGALIAVTAIAGVAFVVLVVAAVISIIRSELGAGMKLVWIVFVVVAPFLGSLAWFAVGRRDAQDPVRRGTRAA
ncbi:PLDc_N domain-containing protein [Pseudonocardia sp. K10HN5]|uniref:PLDc_N domain-containing protein n=2 Tax=Pseudonocardia acidicola TaxID=2724939 RepID=A0ABX1SHC8_9PSEU|nr:PLDc_N domain-containing protein [Pseudonocardia acidicola]